VYLPTVDKVVKVVAELIGRQLWRVTFNNFLHLKENGFPLRVGMLSSRKFYLLTIKQINSAREKRHIERYTFTNEK